MFEDKVAYLHLLLHNKCYNHVSKENGFPQKSLPTFSNLHGERGAVLSSCYHHFLLQLFILFSGELLVVYINI